jgi:undecaprenyl diphosphate synthase
MDNGVRLLHVGRRARLSPEVLRTLDESVALTASNTGMRLGLAISYGGRAEIVDAVRRIAERVRAGELDPASIDEQVFRSHLYHPEIPDPDLLIRTAGELRVSNFLLWQISYAEMHVEEVCWPDFRKEHLHAAFREFGRRVRKFGAVAP